MNTHRSGFALVTVLIFSLAAIMIGAATLVATSSAFTVSQSQYYIKIAEEAAEAGVTYASSCLENNQRNQTWGPSDYQGTTRPTLKQDTTCTGATTTGVSSVLVASDNRLVTEFEVGNLDFTSSSSTQVNSVQISAKGYANVKDGSGGFTKTYEATVKKVIVWESTVVAQTSVSGTNRTCAIMSGSVYCWGYNAYGQLGNGQYLGTGSIESPSSIDSATPVKVKKESGVLAGKTVTNIFVAQYHSCALTSEGKMYCWGLNTAGQLGNGTTTSTGVPVQVTGALSGKTVTAIGGSGNTSCAIAISKIYCWGSNVSGVVGNNIGSGNYNTPQLVTAGNTSTTLPTSYTATGLSTSGSRSYNMCAIANGKAYCWGANNVGQIGDGTTTQRNLPTKVTDTGVLSGKTVTALSQDGVYTGSSAYPHVCAIASGAIYCWGDNYSGKLGRGNTTDSSVPVAVTATGVLAGKTIEGIAVGLYHSCAQASGQVFCWGENGSGQVGDNTTTDRTTPVAVYKESGALLGTTVIQIGAGANRGCAVTSDGKSFCWGLNTAGQIGDGTLTNRYKPTESLFLRPKNNQYIY